MVYIVLFYYEDVVGVFDDLTIASDITKDKNQEAGFFLGDHNWAYRIIACEMNVENGAMDEIEDFWMLKEREGNE